LEVTDDDIYPCIQRGVRVREPLDLSECDARLAAMNPCDRAKSRMFGLRFEIIMFEGEKGRHPKTIGEVYPPGKQPNGFLTAGADGPLDPWGNEFLIREVRSEFELWSSGPGGVPNTCDDVYEFSEPLGCRASLVAEGLGSDLTASQRLSDPGGPVGGVVTLDPSGRDVGAKSGAESEDGGLEEGGPVVWRRTRQSVRGCSCSAFGPSPGK